MIAFNARFDGKVIIPEDAVDLPRDRTFVVQVDTDERNGLPQQEAGGSALQWLVENAVDDELPSDLSVEHDPEYPPVFFFHVTSRNDADLSAE